MTSTITGDKAQYVAAGATEAMGNTPRFGHSSDFSKLFSTEEEAKDYVLGLIFVASIVVAIFLAWSILLLIFKCLGQKKVGFLSGAPFVKAPHEMGHPKRAFRVRLVFLNAAIILIVFSVLLVTNGITNLQETVSTVYFANQDVQSILEDAKSITGSLSNVGESASEVRRQLVSNLGNFCPADPDLEEETGIDFDALATEAIDLLTQLGDFLENDVVEIEDGIEKSEIATEEFEKHAKDLELNDWQSLTIIIPFILIPSFLLVGLMFAWFEVTYPIYTCFVAWFFLPLLTLITIISMVFGAVVSIASVANADFCSGGEANTPDATVLDILAERGMTEDDLVFKAVRYYVKQCETDDPWNFIGDYQTDIAEAATTIEELDLAMTSVTVSRLSLICGKDFAPFESLLRQMTATLNVLGENADAVLEILRCDRIVPIYTSTVYGGTCTYSVTGVTWTFAAFLVIAFMGMLMLTFRSSLWELQTQKLATDSHSSDSGKQRYGLQGGSIADDSYDTDIRRYATAPTGDESHFSDAGNGRSRY